MQWSRGSWESWCCAERRCQRRGAATRLWAGGWGGGKSRVTKCLYTIKVLVKPIIQIMAEYTENCQTLCSPQGFPETETEQYSVSRWGTEK